MNLQSVKGKNLSIPRVLLLVFVPATVFTLAYYLLGNLQNAIPSIMLFELLAIAILFPIELSVVLRASKKDHGNYNFKSAFENQDKPIWWKTILYGFLLFGWAGIMSATVEKFEGALTSPLSIKLSAVIPEYFNWNNIEYLKQYSGTIVLMTCVLYFVLNVIVGPIIEELFFRGYLTSKVSRLGVWAPVLITVLFSLYHFWLPFQNIFRIFIFLPAAVVAWKEKNIYIAIVFHCVCNAFATVSVIMAVYAA